MNSHKHYPNTETLPDVMLEHVCKLGTPEACPKLDFSESAQGRICKKNSERHLPVAISAKGTQFLTCRGVYESNQRVLDLMKEEDAA